MRVSLDSCVWEKIARRATVEHDVIARAIKHRVISAFVCDASFRIEAVRKSNRRSYFSAPKMEIVSPFDLTEIDGEKYARIFSLGPHDNIHPGLPFEQEKLFRDALGLGIKLIRGLSWMGLPTPTEISDPNFYYEETEEQSSVREGRQLAITEQIWKRAVGKAAFDAIGGWKYFDTTELKDKKIFKACAEWADGELVASHYGYKLDCICTEDQGKGTRNSVFSFENRKWLKSDFGVKFFLVSELACWIRNNPS